jgi:hypothetical protein
MDRLEYYDSKRTPVQSGIDHIGSIHFNGRLLDHRLWDEMPI